MRTRLLTGTLLSLLLTSGCAGISPAQVGQTAGTVAGMAIVPGVGAPVGALVGLLAGMVVQGQVDKATERHERKELGEQLRTAAAASESGLIPSLGEPRRVWVDEAVQDGRLVAGHFEARPLP